MSETTSELAQTKTARGSVDVMGSRRGSAERVGKKETTRRRGWVWVCWVQARVRRVCRLLRGRGDLRNGREGRGGGEKKSTLHKLEIQKYGVLARFFLYPTQNKSMSKILLFINCIYFLFWY